MDRALSLAVPDPLRHRILRRYRDHHVYVIWHQVPFLDPALPLLRKTPEYLSQLPAYLTKYRFLPELRNDHDVLLTLPTAVP